MTSPLWCAVDEPHKEHTAKNEFGGTNYCTGRVANPDEVPLGRPSTHEGLEGICACPIGKDHPKVRDEPQWICEYCRMPVYKAMVRTERTFHGPFWREGWVHLDSNEVKCWTPGARPVFR